ncbi:sigma-70 family RNA polymerase sigma factor [Nocardioides guangzhouensis]|uniref:sigma-70 family RNA polymerase sigma factor n=1 Tax=Nocardioides guangzhouensis TaxID=2497878 RepID=UPI0014385D43|nr:sigma-70 family RNA polymerase sigma factor [Nocardioides guangzhouensis]
MSHVSDVDAADDAGPRDVPDAVSLLYRSQHRRLVGLAALLVDDRATAEDVVQDAFVGLCRNWRRLRDPAAATGYLNRAVVNGGRDRLRRGRASATGRLRMVPRPEGRASAEHDAVERDVQDRLWRAVTRLPLRQRQVLVLRYYLDQTEAEIADILQVSHGSVKRHASRGLEALARSWEAAS